MVSERIMDRPALIMVANWREKDGHVLELDPLGQADLQLTSHAASGLFADL
jgi:hypothetical protein